MTHFNLIYLPSEVTDGKDLHSDLKILATGIKALSHKRAMGDTINGSFLRSRCEDIMSASKTVVVSSEHARCDTFIAKMFKCLSNPELYAQFLRLTAASINTTISTTEYGKFPWDTETWPKARGNLNEVERVDIWARSGTTSFYYPELGLVLTADQYLKIRKYCGAIHNSVIPVFDSTLEKLLKSAKEMPKQPTKKEEKKQMLFKNSQTVDAVFQTNKDAVKIAAKLSVGKAANTMLLSKVVGKFPWYARMFGKAKEFEQNPFAKLGSAELVLALSKHFAPENKKLAYLSEAMLQEAMVDLVTNSTQLNSLIADLTALVPDLPGTDKE